MDYHFTVDDHGRPVAAFTMGHEAIGRWLSEELGSNPQRTEQLLQRIEQLELRQCHRHRQIGSEFQLRIEHDEIEIIALALAAEVDDELPEETELFDQQLYAECGLEDFKQLLLAWLAFIS